MQVPVIENVLKVNDELADQNRRALRQAGVYTLDLIGAPGSGKTTLLEATLDRLKDLRIGVICGDLATQRDADRIARFNAQVVQVNTGKTCHLEAHHVGRALKTLELDTIDLLFIENVGNLICPVGFDLGQDAKVGVFCTSGGDDKAAKHPYIVSEASALILTKIDLLPHVSFDRSIFYNDIRRLNLRCNAIELSPRTGQGMEHWIDWLRSRVNVPALAD